MKEAFSLFVLGMLLILGISAFVGVIMFVVDIWKWPKRPERITTMEEDLSKQVIHQDCSNENIKDLEVSNNE